MSFNIKLLDTGAFEVSSTDGRSLRVLNNDGDSKSWAVMGRDWTGVRWSVLSIHYSLDDAFNAAVSEASSGQATNYTVTLLDGHNFKRPGVKPIEEVMASAGWCYVTELIGFVSHKASTSNLTSIEVRNEVSKYINIEGVRLGEATFTGEEADGDYWLLDLVIDYGGWISLKDIENTAAIEFKKLDINVICSFDYRLRTNLARNDAIIIKFPERISK